MSGQENWAPPPGHGGVSNQQPTGYGVNFSDVSAGNVPRSAIYEPDKSGVTIRPLRDDPVDAEFAARLMIEAFRGKIVHAAGESNLSTVQKNVAVNHQGQSPAFYARTFVAEYEGRRAGIVQLKFKGDTERERDDYLNQLGCCALFGLWRLDVVTKEKVPRGKCYLDHIAVDAGFRGRGIGKALMEKAEQEARARGSSAIYLAVVTTNRAKSLYERQGYIVTSEETCCGCMNCWLGEPGAFIMEKRLR